MVEHDLAKVGVASSNLVSRSKLSGIRRCDAGIAQLVEHDLAKVGVASSNLVSRSNLFSSYIIFLLCSFSVVKIPLSLLFVFLIPAAFS